MKLKVAHLTSVHPRYDTRIFVKQCCSLTKMYDVHLVVADGVGNENINGVNILDIGKFNGRKNRIINAPKAILIKALEVDADLYHLHDPELILIGLKLKKLGKKVIFDSHEDIPNQILSKHYINPLIKKPLSFGAKAFEQLICSHFDAIVAATPFIRDKFLKINSNTIDVNNFPKLEEFNQSEANIKNGSQVCYVGGLADVRGIVEMVESVSLTKTDSTLRLAGNFADSDLESKVKKMNGWKAVNFLGFVDRKEVQNTMSTSIAGLVVLHPTISYIDSLPVKMFEYMIAGIPVIASDFPLWRSIIDESKCGLCVDPLDTSAIANAIDYLIEHPSEAVELGRNGRFSVIEKYNWDIEEAKLFDLYSKLL